ncbi:heme peroxidase [Lentinula raphanica]|nr:heme peroxidase [Lentinula raphanica]
MIWRSLILALIVGHAHTRYVWSDHLYDELEHLLVDQQGFNSGANIKRAIEPCTNYVNGPQTLGRTTAAQWLRVAFHDFSTADVAAGTGGLDASIGWETEREENDGSAFNDTLSFFAPFVNRHVSMADMIALGVITSIGSCSSPSIHVPLRGGRIDATEGGAFGVPAPETDIQTTLDQFEQAGFNQQDSIALTACGHTLGSVHHAGFPQVVGPEAVTPNNTGGGEHFDSTLDVFDILVVNEYLEGTGKRGGPLVTTDNVTVRSDLRLYESDNNATMRGLSDSTEHFVSRCISLMARMLDTVPSSTVLSDVISPVDVKPVNVSLDLMEDESGQHILFSGFIRVMSRRTSVIDLVVRISWLDRTGRSSSVFVTEAKYDAAVQKGSGMFGDTFFHAFNTTIDPSLGISFFNVTVNDPTTNQSDVSADIVSGYPIEDRVFLMKSRSTVDDEGNAGVTAAVRLAALFCSDYLTYYHRFVYSHHDILPGTMSPSISTLSLQLTSLKSTDSGYVVFNASTQLPSGIPNGYQITVDVAASLGDEEITDTFRRIKS